MSKKKILLGIVAVMLCCTISVLGTMAWLHQDTGTLKNTFVSGNGLGDLTFQLIETKVERQGDGSYVKGSGTVTAVTNGAGNDYELTPHTTLYKDPYVSLSGRSSIPAYLFIEVATTLPQNGDFTWSVDTNKWTKLNVTGEHSGTVYYYNSGNAVNSSNATTYPILTGNKVTVNDIDLDDYTNKIEMNFYAYLVQASAGGSSTDLNATNAVTAWNATYGAS